MGHFIALSVKRFTHLLRQQKGLYQLTAIHIKLQPGLCEEKRFPSSSVKRHLSLTARETILQTSQITAFEPLSKALQHLANEDTPP